MSSYTFFLIAFFCSISGLFGEIVNPVQEAKRDVENVTVDAENIRQSRSSKDSIYRGLIVCAFRYEAACFMDVAENYLDLKRQELLVQADQQVARAAGSSPQTNRPSQVAHTIEKLFADLAGLFREGFASMFGAKEEDDDLSADKSKDVEDDDDEDEDDDDKADDNISRDVGEGRKKKKKKKKKRHIFAIFMAVVAKLGLLTKLIQAGLLFKIALATVAILGVSVAKLIFLIKHGKQKTIYYENSHHDHHYQHDDIYEHDDHGWGRSANAAAYWEQISTAHKQLL